MLHYQVIPVTHYQQNCSLLWCDETRQAVLIDPGGDIDQLMAALNTHQLVLSQIWLTHGHWDHVGGAGLLRERFHVPIIGPHKDDQFWIDTLPTQGPRFGFPAIAAFVPDRYLQDGDVVTLGSHRFQVLHCPGHTPGHVVFYSAEMNRAFVGDVLFVGSMGRTDFPKGNHAQLIQSITQKLWPLGNQTVFVPGHGPEGSLGQERQTNPYVADKVLQN
jgi:hydroxyacylglutathione hydrolase